MKQTEKIYQANKKAIDELLIENGYPCSYDGLMDAIDSMGDSFLYKVYHFAYINWNNAEGKENWWSKFKNLFHQASETATTTSNVVNGVDTWMNPNTDSTTETSTQTEPEAWSPKLLWWGAAAIGVIIILIIIYFITRKTS